MASYFGIYRGTCVDNADPKSLSRIRLTCPQVLDTNISNWAYPCLPVDTTANHVDHVAHTAASVAALLVSHSISGTTGAASAGTAHTHTFSTTASHTGTGGPLSHPHATSADLLDKDGSEIGLTAAEHTYHRKVPNIQQGIWVMFEGGDPNFPIWMGVY